MGFDLARFQSTQFQARTAEVELPALAAFFAPGERPAFTVRGLTFEEIARADVAADRSKVMLGLVEALAGKSAPEQVAALKAALGHGEATPEHAVKRLEMLAMGAVEPALALSDVVRLADAFPIEFRILSDKVLELTGQGKVPAGPQDSGASPASEPA